MRRGPWLNLLLGACAAALILVVGGYLLREPILRGVGRWFVVSDPPARADFIFMLAGDPNVRPAHAARLYRAGLAPEIVTARPQPRPVERAGLTPEEIEITLLILRREGVPDSAITILDTPSGVTSTRDEAGALREYLRTRPPGRILVVTSDYHTRRARWTLERALPDAIEIRMMAAPDDRFSAADWWKREAGFLAYVNEALKWMHTLVFTRADGRARGGAEVSGGRSPSPGAGA